VRGTKCSLKINSVWYFQYYDFSSGYNSLTKKDVRHYAMLVNHDTRGIGCAQASYFNETTERFTRIAICNYGNGFKVGDPLYEPGVPCQDVPSNYCDDGLVIIPS